MGRCGSPRSSLYWRDHHTCRTWLDSIGSPIGVRQRLMRPSDMRTFCQTANRSPSLLPLRHAPPWRPLSSTGTGLPSFQRVGKVIA